MCALWQHLYFIYVVARSKLVNWTPNPMPAFAQNVRKSCEINLIFTHPVTAGHPS